MHAEIGYRRWCHSQYGGSHGVCETCHLLIADCLTGPFMVFDLGKK